MKTLGILLIGSSMFLAGCACDCDEKLKAAGLSGDTTGGAAGSYITPDATSDNAGNGTQTNDGSGSETNTSQGANTSGNTSGNVNEKKGKEAGATMHYEPNKKSSSVPTSTDPRKYDENSTGGGYRTDSIKSYKGIDGSARDKGAMDKTP